MNKFYILLLILSIMIIGCGVEDRPADFTSKYPPIVPPGGAPLPTYDVDTIRANVESRLETVGITYEDLGLTAGWPTITSPSEDLEAASDVDGYFHNFTGLLWDEDKTQLIIPLPPDHSVSRKRESIIGNILLDGLLWKGKTLEPNLKFAISNGGGLRGDKGTDHLIPGELVTMSEISNFLFWGNQSAIADIALEDVVTLFENSYGALPSSSGNFFHVSGIIIELDLTQPTGSRIQTMWWWDNETETKEEFYNGGSFKNGWSADDTVKMMSSDYVINVQLGLSGSQYEGELNHYTGQTDDTGLTLTEAQSAGEYLTYLEEQQATELYTGFGYNDTEPFRLLMTRFPGVVIPPNFVGGYAPEDIIVYIGHNYNDLYSTIKVEYFTSSPFMSIVCDTPELYDLIEIASDVGDTTGEFEIVPKPLLNLDESHAGEYELTVEVRSTTDASITRTITFEVVADTDIIDIVLFDDTTYYIFTNSETFVLDSIDSSTLIETDLVDMSGNGTDEAYLLFEGNLYIYNGAGQLSSYPTPEGYKFDDEDGLFDLGVINSAFALLVSDDTTPRINKLFKMKASTDRTVTYNTVDIGFGEIETDDIAGIYLYTLADGEDTGTAIAQKIKLSDMTVLWSETVQGSVDGSSSIDQEYSGSHTDKITVKTSDGTFVFYVYDANPPA